MYLHGTEEAGNTVNDDGTYMRALRRHSLSRIAVVFVELLDKIRTHVAVHLLRTLGNLKRVGRWNRFFSVTLELLDEVRNVTTSQRDVLDAAPDNVTKRRMSSVSAGPTTRASWHSPLRNRDHVRHTVTRINHRAGEGTVPSILSGLDPGRRQSKHGLHGDVQTWSQRLAIDR